MTKKYFCEKEACIFHKTHYYKSVVTVSDKKEVVYLHFVYPNLVSVMKEHDLDYKGLADVLGISEYAAYRRLRGFTGWKLSETIHLCRHFGDCSFKLLG